MWFQKDPVAEALGRVSKPSQRLTALAFSFFYCSACLALTYSLYQLGVGSGFKFDDFPNIVFATELRPETWNLQTFSRGVLSNNSGPLGRPISIASLMFDIHYKGLGSEAILSTNICIHLLNGVLVWSFSSLLVRTLAEKSHIHNRVPAAPIGPNLIGLLPAALFLLHPYHVSTVLYAVQRMALLSTFFSLAAMIFYLRLRRFQCCGNGGRFPAVLAGTTLVCCVCAVFSKENAAVLLIVIPLIEFFCFKSGGATAHARFVRQVAFALPILYCALLAGHLGLSQDEQTVRYLGRAFDLHQRLTAELAIVLDYFRQALIPNLSAMSFHHDDAFQNFLARKKSTSLLHGACLFGLLLLAFTQRKKAPGLGFGVLFFFSAHSLESTVVPLELMYEHRNYFPMAGLFAGLAYELYAMQAKPLSTKQTRLIALVCVCVLVSYPSLLALRISGWNRPLENWIVDAQRKPASPRTAWEVANTYQLIFNRTGDRWAQEESFAWRTQAAQAETHYSDAQLSLLIMRAQSMQKNLLPLFEETFEIVKSRPVRAALPALLNQLVDCVNADKCLIEHHLVTQILLATLENPNQNEKTFKANLMITMKWCAGKDDIPEELEEILWDGYQKNTEDELFREFFSKFLALEGRVSEAINVALGKKMVRLDSEGSMTE